MGFRPARAPVEPREGHHGQHEHHEHDWRCERATRARPGGGATRTTRSAALGVSPRAAEGRVYRDLRRLQAVAAVCSEEPEQIGVWCPYCGRRRLVAQLLPGVSPHGPLWRRWRCPRCGLASHWTEHNVVPLARYPSLDAAWWHERAQGPATS